MVMWTGPPFHLHRENAPSSLNVYGFCYAIKTVLIVVKVVFMKLNYCNYYCRHQHPHHLSWMNTWASVLPFVSCMLAFNIYGFPLKLISTLFRAFSAKWGMCNFYLRWKWKFFQLLNYFCALWNKLRKKMVLSTLTLSTLSMKTVVRCNWINFVHGGATDKNPFSLLSA